MAQVSVAEAKAKFSALLDRALEGEEVEITRRGKLVARLVATQPQRPQIDVEAMRRLIEAQRRRGAVELDPQAFWDDLRGRNHD